MTPNYHSEGGMFLFSVIIVNLKNAIEIISEKILFLYIYWVSVSPIIIEFTP